MSVLNPILVSVAALLITLTFLSAKSWWSIRKMNYMIRGNVDDIKIENDKLYFIIKWKVPSKLQELNPGDHLNSGSQFYHHLVRLTPKFENEQKQTEFVNNYINRHIKKTFYLKARVENGTVREVKAFEASGRRLIVNIIVLGIFAYGVFMIRHHGWI